MKSLWWGVFLRGLCLPLLRESEVGMGLWKRFSCKELRFALLLHNKQRFIYIIMENKKDQLQIELTPEVAQGEYANLAVITHSSAEFVTDFVRVLPGVPKALVKSRIIMAPEHAKRLLYALQDNINKYEKAFGAIRLPGSPEGTGRTGTPFGMPEGMA